MKNCRLLIVTFQVLIAAAASGQVHRPDLTATALGRPDLIVSDLRIGADGRMVFDIRNASPAVVDTPFQVDAWLDGYLRETFWVGGMKSLPVNGVRLLPTALPFGANERRTFVLAQVKVDLCSPNHSLKVVTDTTGAVDEGNKANNTMSWSGTTPCPDLAIKSISKHWQNNQHTEFNAEVVIINQGTGDAGPFAVAVGGTATVGVPSGAPLAIPSLKAGETMTFHAGNAYIPDGISVHVVVDIGNQVKELDETNNVANKSIH